MQQPNSHEQLDKGGNKGKNNQARYYFSQNAFNRFAAWLMLNWKHRDCVHFVLTIPWHEYYTLQKKPAGKQRERFWQGRVKTFLEIIRRKGWIQKNSYCWFKERNQQGVLHWHFIVHGSCPPREELTWDRKLGEYRQLDFRDLNAVWSNLIRKHRVSPHYKNAVTSNPEQKYLYGTSMDAVKYFAKYFQKGKKEKFYTKAYQLPELPGSIQGGSFSVTAQEFKKLATNVHLYSTDYSNTFVLDLNQYAKLLNERAFLWS